jgi:chromosome segregation protein
MYDLCEQVPFYFCVIPPDRPLLLHFCSPDDTVARIGHFFSLGARKEAMYLKRLHLHGFKSFATRTGLEFAPGITAIVGPNGSGKSNIADGLRWVLGEQNMRQLRGKKGDDIIFAGGNARAALGMAEVTLILDNSSGWLPSEFTEVAVTRRTYRTGETEYLINNAKVRLKDVVALLQQARIGSDSYTIIGQGLVDQALSARAEDRRGLFEDAAGIRHFQSQRNDAEQRLRLTQENLSRLHDILAEIEPRLGPLAEQARRAQEFISARAELDRHLRLWYSVQWNAGQLSRLRAEAAEQQTVAHVESLRAALESQDTEQTELRVRRESLGAVILDLRRRRGEATGRVQTLERESAVARERASSLDRTRTELSGEQESVAAQIAANEQQITMMETAIADADVTIETETRAIADEESALHHAAQERTREEARLRNAQRDALQAQSRVSSATGELTRLNKQIAERQLTLATRRANSQQAQEQAERAQSRLDGARAGHESLRAELGDMQIDREANQQSLREMQESAEILRGSLGDAQRERRALTDRYALLQEMQGGDGDVTAAIDILDALPFDERPTIIGTLAELLRSAPEHEAALEAALRPFLHALVAASEDDAWRAAEILHAANCGRVTIVWPVDGEKSSAQPGATYVQDLLESTTDATARSVTATLLGSLCLVPEAAPDMLRWEMRDTSIITPGGTIANPTGWLALAGTTPDANSGLLARTRELRILPEQIDSFDERIEQLTDESAGLKAQIDRLKGELQRLDRDIKNRETHLAESAKNLGALQREAEKLTNASQISAAVEQQLEAEVLNIEEEIDTAKQRLSEAESAHRELAEVWEMVQAEMAALDEAGRTRQEELARRRTALAVQRQEQKSLIQRVVVARQHQQDLTLQLDRRSERLVEIGEQLAVLTETITKQAHDLDEQRQIARDLSVHLQAQEADATAIDQRLTELEKAQAAERIQLQQAENDYRKALLDAQRARDNLTNLQTQMGEELYTQEVLEITAVTTPPAEEMPSNEEMGRMRKQIDHLRARLKSLGGYDPEAPQAYEELKTRYEFLTSQVRDMEDASARLRAVIIELDTTMRRRFEETFKAVNERFGRHFTTLFNGGAARLELVSPKRGARDEDDGESDTPEEPAISKRTLAGGVEVYVQIPGKKVQDLGLLSGGERAMVSAALLFALLETNPPPFCLLDEVDAALDESNVVRFCEILQQIADRTQFIVITHNRVTMTHANAIYGVSMTDSISRILSMRLAAEVQTA